MMNKFDDEMNDSIVHLIMVFAVIAGIGILIGITYLIYSIL